MPSSVVLSPHFETFIHDKIQSSRYNNASEVVRAGLLEDAERQQAVQLLRADIAAGKTSGAAQLAEVVIDRLQAKYSKQIENS